MQLIEEYPIQTKGRCYYTDHETTLELFHIWFRYCYIGPTRKRSDYCFLFSSLVATFSLSLYFLYLHHFPWKKLHGLLVHMTPLAFSVQNVPHLLSFVVVLFVLYWSLLYLYYSVFLYLFVSLFLL